MNTLFTLLLVIDASGLDVMSKTFLAKILEVCQLSMCRTTLRSSVSCKWHGLKRGNSIYCEVKNNLRMPSVLLHHLRPSARTAGCKTKSILLAYILLGLCAFQCASMRGVQFRVSAGGNMGKHQVKEKGHELFAHSIFFDVYPLKTFGM